MQLSRQQRAALNAVMANRAYMRRTGLTYAGQRIWTTPEMETLRRLHPDYGALVGVLPGRTRKAIENKAQRLGLPKPRRVWSEAEFQLMKPLYVRGAPMRSILEHLPGKTAKQVWHKASSQGVRRPRHPPRITGLPQVDVVRQRAFGLCMSMAELEEAAGAPVYFRRPKRVNWSAMQRVLPELGGRIVVSWHG
jgi:hypothetical protein